MKLLSEDFGKLLTETQYTNFRASINKYRKLVDQAYLSDDRDESIELWRKVFGDEFAKGVNVLAEKAEGISAFSGLMRFYESAQWRY